jgi:hypothetical protein
MLPKRKDVKTFASVVKFNAREGKFIRVDRTQDEDGNWRTEPHEIPSDDFEFVADLANLQIGWLHFGGNGVAPDFRMFDLDADIGEKPGDTFKEGFRLKVKLTNGAGDDVRELASTAIGLWKSVDELHTAYTKGATKNRGKLPLVGVHEIIKVEGKTATYRPDFKILKWVARPKDLA